MAKTDVEITPSFSCDIHWIEAEYMRDEAEKKKKSLVDTSPVVNMESLEVSPTPPAPTFETSGISSPTTSSVPTYTSHPPLT